jgi:hypothetical protein
VRVAAVAQRHGGPAIPKPSRAMPMIILDSAAAVSGP